MMPRESVTSRIKTALKIGGGILTYREIADYSGTTVATVKSIIAMMKGDVIEDPKNCERKCCKCGIKFQTTRYVFRCVGCRRAE